MKIVTYGIALSLVVATACVVPTNGLGQSDDEELAGNPSSDDVEDPGPVASGIATSPRPTDAPDVDAGVANTVIIICRPGDACATDDDGGDDDDLAPPLDLPDGDGPLGAEGPGSPTPPPTCTQACDRQFRQRATRCRSDFQFCSVSVETAAEHEICDASREVCDASNRIRWQSCVDSCAPSQGPIP